MQDNELAAVEIVDVLMTNYRNGVEPDDTVKLQAYELGIDVQTLKRVMEDVDGTDRNTEDWESTEEDEADHAYS